MILYFVTARGLKEAHMDDAGEGSGAIYGSQTALPTNFENHCRRTHSNSPNHALVLCGPGRNRDRMLADLKSAGHVRPMMSVGTSMGGRGAANEVMRDGRAGNMLAEHRMVQEIRLLEEAWQRISTNGAVAYGRTEIEQATQEGAVDTLLIGADVLRGADEGASWTAIAEAVEKFSGTVVQCSVDHDAGEQLMGYGGAVALLHYAR